MAHIPALFQNMRQVTQDEFYAAMAVDCHPTVRGRYHDPLYGSDFKLRSGQVIGRTLQVGDTPHYKPVTLYFLPVR